MAIKLGCDYHPLIRPAGFYPVSLRPARSVRMAMDAAPRRARDEAEPAQRVGLADQIRDYLGRFEVSDFVKILPASKLPELREALADYGADEIGVYTGTCEDDLDPNDATRLTGAVPKNAMDRALKLTPSLAHVTVGDDSHSDYQRIGYHRGDASKSSFERARKIAPGLADIKVGAI